MDAGVDIGADAWDNGVQMIWMVVWMLEIMVRMLVWIMVRMLGMMAWIMVRMLGISA